MAGAGYDISLGLSSSESSAASNSGGFGSTGGSKSSLSWQAIALIAGAAVLITFVVFKFFLRRAG